MSNDYRALCAELLDFVERLTKHYYEPAELTIRARAALARPEPEGPTVMEIIELADEIEAAELGQVDLVRAAVARWGRPVAEESSVAQPADGEVVELVVALRADAECVEVEHYDLCNMTADQMRRAADLLERLSPPQLVPVLPESAQVIEPSPSFTRTLLVPVAQPVPVAERLPGPEECLDEGWAWFFNPRTGWRQATQPVHSTYTHWLPADALPVPREVEHG